MKKLAILSFVAALALTGIVQAHSGAKGAVKARMDSMSQIGANMKILGEMAKGKVGFDQVAAQQAAGNIAEHASQVAALFEEKDVSAPSEARPEIWDNWTDFVSKATTMADIATDIAPTLTTLGDIRAAMPRLGSACKSCHKDYRL